MTASSAGGIGPEELAGAECSRAGCREAALWRVNWRNPRIHSPERVKVWVACDEHREFLETYLSSREFPVVVTALDVAVDRVPS